MSNELFVEEGYNGAKYYDKDAVDALLAEKDKEIAELKDKCQMHDFFWEGCGFEKWGFKNTIAVSEAFDRLKAENERLLQSLYEAVQVQGFKNLNIPESLARLMGEVADARGENRRQQREIAEIKAENERLKKEVWEADERSIDAGATSVEKMEELRATCRALWLARAERASDKARIFYFAETCGVELNIDGFSNKEKGHTRMRTARWWRTTWLNVERKCRAKAEEYK